MAIDTKCRHITPAGGNIFADLGFEPEEAARLKAESDAGIAKELDVMTKPTTDQLLTAFDACGGSVVQPMSLRFSLEKQGFGFEQAADAIDAALATNVLGRTPAGGLFLITKI